LCTCVAMLAQRGGDTNAVAGAEAVIGLEFTSEERALVARSQNERIRAYEALRKENFPNELAPAFLFNPLPNGFKMDAEKRRPAWTTSKKALRPRRDEDLAFMTVAELAALLRSRQITSEELTRYFLDRLKKHGPRLQCVVTLTEERAMAEARAADAELRAGKWRGPLHGVPYAAKDLLDTEGIATTWGVSLHTNRVPSQDAAVVRKLREAGAVLVAKTTLGELAMGDVWFGGKTRNPWKSESGSSGSSAGSAAAVAAGLVPFAIGSETMGSIVSPATVCGVTGLRPTFGRVSRQGAMTLCWSLDKLGPLARTAEDCALVLDAIRGADAGDPTTVNAPFDFIGERSVKKLRVAYVKSDFEKEEGNQTNDVATLAALRKLGIDLREVEWPKVPTRPLWLTLSVEAAAAFDELTRSNEDDKLVQQSAAAWPNTFRGARFIPAVEYIQAMRLRTRLVEEMAKLFADVDVIVAPSWRGNQMVFSNMAGYPCVVVPNGDKTGGAPASICFVAGLYKEAEAVRVAAAYQRATNWHLQRPPE